MTTHTATTLDDCSPHRHQTLYSNRIYARTTTVPRLSNVNRPFHSYLKTLPAINICENLLYDVTIAGDAGLATSSSYINSSEPYDNTFANTYDNPIQYFENYPSKSTEIVNKSLNNLPHSNENFYDHTEADRNNEKYSSNTSRSTSPALFYLENKNLAICACIISLLLLSLIGLGIFVLNKLIRPVIINTTVNNHYGIMNTTNTTTTTASSVMASRSIISKSLVMPLRRSSIDILTTSTTTKLRDDFDFPCPPKRWGRVCENICKPCGLGVCDLITGNCICPDDMYGEFCDLWKVNDKPKRGDMMS
ncbi:unnamed protein product [Rotaria magnacalcarata]|uniref:EGF-like domain-containing protein n=1 Tax=Rotaria magnacalcarata TaxID=392030 RepID=A0A818ZFB2_9BILA|nr:unnamed protein product [Rotaria magnacalcarata]CAF2053649.1 unnamed protein product [Rotaria magnacalcarata]CAF3723708.1 unnamed protein product [Rotaria magnacalcarata]CAF3766557.1 unnamed protein product [Rotaria magnacalcarata]